MNSPRPDTLNQSSGEQRCPHRVRWPHQCDDCDDDALRRLQRAAPELLEALREIESECRYVENPYAKSAYKIACAAIARATA